MRVLVTGMAGFIGYFTAKKCIQQGYEVVGIDNINDYYQSSLKLDRLKQLGFEVLDYKSSKYKGLKFIKMDLINQASIKKLFSDESFDVVIHLASQVGVRYSIENPQAYIKSNCEGFVNILEGCRHSNIKHFIYASSSSIYGLNHTPFQAVNPVDHPISFYAATKRSSELMAHVYSHLYGIPSTGLRFFTVYGPWGRPDMAPFLFVDAIMNGREIKVFNNGNMERDFTYVEDIVEAVIRSISHPPKAEKTTSPNISSAPFRIYNIGSSKPVNILNFIKVIEKYTGKIAKKKYMPLQKGDIVRTCADIEDLFEVIDFKPMTSLDEGIKKFIEWYKFYNSSRSFKVSASRSIS